MQNFSNESNGSKRRRSRKCPLCGQESEKLEVHHIIPISEGGDNSVDNLIELCPKCHMSIHYSPVIREFEFEHYLLRLLTESEKFRNVRSNVIVDRARTLEADLIAERRINGKWQTIVIECKSQGSFTEARLQGILAQMQLYRENIGESQLIFAFLGELPVAALYAFKKLGIEIWDSRYLSREFRSEIKKVPHPILQSLFMSVKPKRVKSEERRLISELKLCKPGLRDWTKYEKLIGEILERLFCPPLSSPISQLMDASKANRRDFILPNRSQEGFWYFLRSRYSADYIVMDPKNLGGKVGKADVLQISNYLKKHGTGLLGLIICRNGCDKSSIHTLREVWALENKLIVILDDTDIEKMLLNREARRPPEEIIQQKIDDFRLAI